MRLDTLSGVEINMRVILVNSPPEVCMACCLITGGSFAEGRMTKNMETVNAVVGVVLQVWVTAR